MSKTQELLLSASAFASSKKAKLQSLAFATVASVSTVGLTVSDGVLPAGQPAGTVSFDLADKTQVGTSVGVAVSNLWNAFIFVLPYLAVFVGVALVIGIVMRKVGQGGR